MRLKYYEETDSLYIDMSEKTSSGTQEIVPGIVVDFDENNNIVGIDIQHASEHLNLSELEISRMPSKKFIYSPAS